MNGVDGTDVAVLLCPRCGDPNGHTATLTELCKAARDRPGSPGSVAIRGRTDDGRPRCPDYVGERPCESCAETDQPVEGIADA